MHCDTRSNHFVWTSDCLILPDAQTMTLESECCLQLAVCCITEDGGSGGDCHSPTI